MRRFELAALFLVLSGSARADQIQFTQASTAISGNTTVNSPYAGMTITGNATTGVLTFSIGVDGNPAKFTGLGFNLAPGINTTDFTTKVDNSTGGNAAGYALQKGGNMSSFGSFAAVFGPPTNARHSRLSALSFEFDFTPGKFGEALPSNFEVKNSGPNGGNYFALDYFPSSGNTGFVDVNTINYDTGDPGPVTPEPSSSVLMSLGGSTLLLVGYGSYLRRRKTIAWGLLTTSPRLAKRQKLNRGR